MRYCCLVCSLQPAVMVHWAKHTFQFANHQNFHTYSHWWRPLSAYWTESALHMLNILWRTTSSVVLSVLQMGSTWTSWALMATGINCLKRPSSYSTSRSLHLHIHLSPNFSQLPETCLKGSYTGLSHCTHDHTKFSAAAVFVMPRS